MIAIDRVNAPPTLFYPSLLPPGRLLQRFPAPQVAARSERDGKFSFSTLHGRMHACSSVCCIHPTLLPYIKLHSYWCLILLPHRYRKIPVGDGLHGRRDSRTGATPEGHAGQLAAKINSIGRPRGFPGRSVSLVASLPSTLQRRAHIAHIACRHDG